MTPSQFIDMLGAADPREIAEIRRLLGVPDVRNYPELMLIGPGQDDYGRRGKDSALDVERKRHFEELANTILGHKPAPFASEPDSLDARDPVKRESV